MSRVTTTWKLGLAMALAVTVSTAERKETTSGQSDELNDIREAVLRLRLRQSQCPRNDERPGPAPQYPLVCLWLFEKDAPDSELLRRFKEPWHVRAVTECRGFEAMSYSLQIGPIRWINDSQVRVEAAGLGAHLVYEVERSKNGWRARGPLGGVC